MYSITGFALATAMCNAICIHESACKSHPDYSELLSELVSICIRFEGIKSLGGLVSLVLLLQFTQDVMRCIQQLLQTQVIQWRYSRYLIQSCLLFDAPFTKNRCITA